MANSCNLLANIGGPTSQTCHTLSLRIVNRFFFSTVRDTITMAVLTRCKYFSQTNVYVSIYNVLWYYVQRVWPSVLSTYSLCPLRIKRVTLYNVKK